MEGNAERLDVAGQSLVVRGDERQLHRELTAAPAPEQVEQAVVAVRREDGDGLHVGLGGELPAHPEVLSEHPELGPKRRLGIGQAGQMELDPHEKAAGLRVARVLIGMDQVRPGRGKKAGDCGDDPGAVGTRDRQPADVGPKHIVHSRCIGKHRARLDSGRAAASPDRDRSPRRWRNGPSSGISDGWMLPPFRSDLSAPRAGESAR